MIIYNNCRRIIDGLIIAPAISDMAKTNTAKKITENLSICFAAIGIFFLLLWCTYILLSSTSLKQ